MVLLKCYGEFSWLPNSVLAGVVLPSLCFVEPDDLIVESQGYYSHDEQKITVGIFDDDEYGDTMASTMAHEFMHHRQLMSGISLENPSQFDDGVSYNEGISRFFNADPREYEALIFEVKVAKNNLNDWFLNKLVAEY